MDQRTNADSDERFRNGEITALPKQKEQFSIEGSTKRFLPIEETAEVLGLSVFFIRQGIRAGWIPHIKCGCKNMINIAKLIEILDSESVNGNRR